MAATRQALHLLNMGLRAELPKGRRRIIILGMPYAQTFTSQHPEPRSPKPHPRPLSKPVVPIDEAIEAHQKARILSAVQRPIPIQPITRPWWFSPSRQD